MLATVFCNTIDLIIITLRQFLTVLSTTRALILVALLIATV
jgi:hypothetical protein